MSDLFGYLPPAIRGSRWMREGHNVTREVGPKSPAFRATHQVAAARQDVRAAKRGKSDETVAAAKSNLQAKRGERRADRQAIRSDRQDVRAARRTGGDVQSARQSLRAAQTAGHAQFAGAIKAPRDQRQTVERRGVTPPQTQLPPGGY